MSEQAREIPADQGRASSAARPRILLIEDDVLIRSVIAEELRELGVTVIEAGTTAEANAYFECGNSPDLIFSDVRMPGPVNGIDFANHIRRRYPALPIILTSGFSGVDDIGHAVPFLKKPYQIAEAIALMFDHLGHPPPFGHT